MRRHDDGTAEPAGSGPTVPVAAGGRLVLAFDETALRLLSVEETAPGTLASARLVATARLDSDGRGDGTALRRSIGGKGATPVTLWLPPSQIAVGEIAIPRHGQPRPEALSAMASALTGQPARDLAVAVFPLHDSGPAQRPDRPALLLAAYAQTIAEARAYAAKWGFEPIAVATEIGSRLGQSTTTASQLAQSMVPGMVLASPALEPIGDRRPTAVVSTGTGHAAERPAESAPKDRRHGAPRRLSLAAAAAGILVAAGAGWAAVSILAGEEPAPVLAERSTVILSNDGVILRPDIAPRPETRRASAPPAASNETPGTREEASTVEATTVAGAAPEPLGVTAPTPPAGTPPRDGEVLDIVFQAPSPITLALGEPTRLSSEAAEQSWTRPVQPPRLTEDPVVAMAAPEEPFAITGHAWRPEAPTALGDGVPGAATPAALSASSAAPGPALRVSVRRDEQPPVDLAEPAIAAGPGTLAGALAGLAAGRAAQSRPPAVAALTPSPVPFPAPPRLEASLPDWPGVLTVDAFVALPPPVAPETSPLPIPAPRAAVEAAETVPLPPPSPSGSRPAVVDGGGPLETTLEDATALLPPISGTTPALALTEQSQGSDAGPVSAPLPPRRLAYAQPESPTVALRPTAVSLPTTAGLTSEVAVGSSEIAEAALIGVMTLDGRRQALMRLGTGRYHRVEEGDSLGGWRIQAIDEDRVRLFDGQTARTLSLITR
ncbi:MAG: hypothetical protein AAF577_09465 [Pseudomonadota bacterium]